MTRRPLALAAAATLALAAAANAQQRPAAVPSAPAPQLAADGRLPAAEAAPTIRLETRDTAPASTASLVGTGVAAAVGGMVAGAAAVERNAADGCADEPWQAGLCHVDDPAAGAVLGSGLLVPRALQQRTGARGGFVTSTLLSLTGSAAAAALGAAGDERLPLPATIGLPAAQVALSLLLQRNP